MYKNNKLIIIFTFVFPTPKNQFLLPFFPFHLMILLLNSHPFQKIHNQYFFFLPYVPHLQGCYAVSTLFRIGLSVMFLLSIPFPLNTFGSLPPLKGNCNSQLRNWFSRFCSRPSPICPP